MEMGKARSVAVSGGCRQRCAAEKDGPPGGDPRDEQGLLYPCVPLVALVLPVTALPACDLVEALHELDAHHVLRVLVAELALDAQADRRAVRDRQRFVVELVGEEGLRMEGIIHVDALVVGAGSVVFHWIGAIKHHVASLAPGPKRLQQRAEARALPFADRAPAFDAIVARDLGAAG